MSAELIYLVEMTGADAAGATTVFVTRWSARSLTAWPE